MGSTQQKRNVKSHDHDTVKSRKPFNFRAESWLQTTEDFNEKNFPPSGK